ncbi:P-loop containing nucleoside triphosphate hydrolase protein [Mycena epipterygia]|nr:P-loop containing nucleoside triphosphate hydrolase protein [Mycena epipterygia]
MQELRSNFMLMATIDTNFQVQKVLSVISPDVPVIQVPQQINNCPPPSRIFHGRQTILQQMHQYFVQTTGKQDIFLLHGLGGSGKTQIALKFIAESTSNFTDIFFIDSSSIETIDTGLKSLAKSKIVGESSKDALQYLRSKQDEWLLFFDNADDPKINLNEYFPQCDHGNIIITSRNPGLVVYASSHSVVSDMEEIDAVDLLLRSAGKEATDDTKTAAVHIVKMLHYLPLAIIQAGAFISKSGDLDGYLALYEQNRVRLLSQKPAQSHDNYAWTVYTTWQISFDQLSQPAATFLQLCSLLHHQGISEQIFKKAATYKFRPSSPSKEELQIPLEFLSQFLGPDGVWDSFSFMDMTNEVRAYSLINFHPKQKMFSMHPLVHDWTCSTLSNQESYHHCMVAIELGIALVEKCSNVLGDNHPNTLQAMANLAVTYHKPEQLKEAEELTVVVLERRRNILGDDHLETLRAMANLSTIYKDQYKFQEAEDLEVLVLQKRRNVLGNNHPHTLEAMGNLALSYHKLGKLKEAEELEAVVLEKKKNILGENHPDTLLAMGNLAVTYNNLGKLKEAQELEVLVLEKKRNILGENHPGTLITMGNLAVTYTKLERWQEAQELGEVVLKKRRNVLGDNHPLTLRAMNNLAVTYNKLERWHEAEELGVTALKKQIDVLGDKHPQTLETMQNLAVTYEQLGKLSEAEGLNAILRGSQT